MLSTRTKKSNVGYLGEVFEETMITSAISYRNVNMYGNMFDEQTLNTHNQIENLEIDIIVAWLFVRFDSALMPLMLV